MYIMICIPEGTTRNRTITRGQCWCMSSSFDMILWTIYACTSFQPVFRDAYSGYLMTTMRGYFIIHSSCMIYIQICITKTILETSIKSQQSERRFSHATKIAKASFGVILHFLVSFAFFPWRRGGSLKTICIISRFASCNRWIFSSIVF